jgi:endonuclease YncB( thermonuclease family)
MCLTRLLSAFLIHFLIVFLTACGGGSGDGVGDGGAAASAPASGVSYCGETAGVQRITGMVSAVHDGDTIRVNSQSIRLNSIDAPELTQAYGKSSRDRLSTLVLGQQVTVSYVQKDAYDRVLGTVFKSDCSNVNLQQVESGSAWYYEAYKCEIDSRQRAAFAAAQASAKAAYMGLWAAPAVAPWIFRNGVEAKVPTFCPNGDAPSY